MAKKVFSQEPLPYSISEISFNLVDIKTPIAGQKKLADWIVSALANEEKKLGSLSINFCSDDYLLEMNRSALNHDFYTDIITFDFCEGNTISGDLYISRDRVKENAKTLDVKFSQELCRVIIHGVLHLCGYKDKKPVDVQLMRDKENYYLSLLP